MPRILVAEDDQFLRDMIRHALEEAGLSVQEAADGKEALASLRTGQFSAVVTDIVMPGFDGLELITALRKTNPTLPIIAMSGASLHSELYLKTARLLGARRVLAKPFPPAELVSLLKELVPAKEGPRSPSRLGLSSRATERFPERDLTVHKFQGPVGYEDCLEAVDAFFAAGPTQRVLWDFSQSDRFEFTPEQEREIVRVVKARGPRPEDSRAATIAPAPAVFGSCRRMEALAEIEGVKVAVGVFRQRDAAMKWLFD